ncbi:MAG: ABC transporter permease [Acidimicrobiia bacterium]
MLQFALKRLLHTLILLFLISVFVFSIMKMAPGDPVTVMLGSDYNPESYARLRTELGLDRSVFVQYGLWVSRFVRGDWGYSYISGARVSKLILHDALPVTLFLSLWSLVFALALALPSGILAALKRNTWVDYTGMGLAIFFNSFPSFYLGIVLIWIFGVSLGWFPTMGYVSPWKDLSASVTHMILPAFTLGAWYAGLIARITRSSLVDVLNQPYIKVARAKGVDGRAVVYKHALRNVLIPVVTIVGLQLGGMLRGAVMTETVFALPGIGRLVTIAVLNREYQLVQATVMVIAIMFIVINLGVDLLYRFLNPRMREA